MAATGQCSKVAVSGAPSPVLPCGTFGGLPCKANKMGPMTRELSEAHLSVYRVAVATEDLQFRGREE